MIKNIIFDLGGVIVEWNPEKIIQSYTQEANDVASLKNVIFDSQEWLKLDEGTISRKEAVSLFCQQLPKHLHEIANSIVFHFGKDLFIYPEMVELITNLKTNGYSLYLLSNTHVSVYEEIRNKPIGKYFDGYLISAIEHVLKPDQRIYTRLLQKFDLMPDECFFIDDTEKNIVAAKKVGIQGHIFAFEQDGIQNLLSDFDHLGINYHV